MPPQLDDYVPARVLKYIGAGKTQSGRARFYVSFVQFAMIAILFYNDNAIIQNIFPTITAWIVALILLGMGLMVFDFIFVLPSEITFNESQYARANRNPTYKQVLENTRRLDKLLERKERYENQTERPNTAGND